MSDMTIEKLAQVIGTSADKLLTQLNDAGVVVSNITDVISDQDKQKLLQHIQGINNSATNRKKITLTKKPLSIGINSKEPSSKKVVQIEFRKKKTLLTPKISSNTVEPVLPTQIAQDISKNSNVEKQVVVVRSVPQKVEHKIVPKKVLQQPAEDNDVPTATNENQVFDDKRPTSRTAVRVARRNITQKIHAFEKPQAPMVYDVHVPETITVSELAKRMSIKGTEVIKVMMNMGSMATINQVLDHDTAVLIVEELGHNVIIVNENQLEEELANTGSEYAAESRPPVVTIMGHVDHGKTSLLDYIRKTSVVSGESGGITQHIGAYHVDTPKGTISFLDTPGHAAFTAMRARGAKVTDIVVIVVAADDGAKPQTIEAIQHAKSADIPIIVAINKIDKPDASPEKVINDLSQHGVMPESWGGDNIFVNVSALTGENVDELLDNILLLSEMLELTAVAKGNAKGVIIESKLDKGRGPISTVLVQSGQLNKGDILVAGLQYGKVKAMFDENNQALSKVGPSMPAEVLGLSGVCLSGDDAYVVNDEKKAKEIIDFRRGKHRDVQLSKQRKVSLDNLFSQQGDTEQQTLNIVLKADVNGSAEAIKDALMQLTNDEVKVNIVAHGVGGITESDVNLAAAASGIVLGFNVRADASAKKIIANEGVDLRYYSVIYDLIDDIKSALSGLLSPELKENIIGVADVRDVFRSPKFGAIAGCMVTEGIIKRNNPIRVLRENVVIFEGVLESLRRFKEDANEVRQGTECGIGVKNYNDVKVGDQIEVFETIELKRQL